MIIPVSISVGMKGFLRLRRVNKFSGKIIQDTGWFPNTILNAGRNNMTAANWLTHCQVGNNNTAPNVNQTALSGYIAGTSVITTTTHGRSGVEPYYGWKRNIYRIAAGPIGGQNLSEVGIGWGLSGDTLISRALILDPVLQTPTTITPLADEFLEVMYELRYYPPLTDVTSPSVVLNGVTYNTITRAASVTGDRWSADIGTAIGQYSGLASDWLAFDGDIGTILTAPSGLSANCDNANQSNVTYSNNSYQRTMTCNTGSTGWNLGSGIRSIRIRTTAGDYQTQFNAVGTGNRIPKTSSYTMYMQWTIGWTEKV